MQGLSEDGILLYSCQLFQGDEIRRVMGLTDLYAILGLAKSCDDSEIKRSYRKLALRLHPDKNRADGAAEAFKKVGVFADVLGAGSVQHVERPAKTEEVRS